MTSVPAAGNHPAPHHTPTVKPAVAHDQAKAETKPTVTGDAATKASAKPSAPTGDGTGTVVNKYA